MLAVCRSILWNFPMGIFLANNTDPLRRRRGGGGIENFTADGSTPFKWDREGVSYSTVQLRRTQGFTVN